MSFDPALLVGFDLSAWTPIAERKRPGTTKGPREWRILETAPFDEPEAKAGRDAGYLLTALTHTETTEVLLVKLTEQAKEALARPVLPKHNGRRHWYD